MRRRPMKSDAAAPCCCGRIHAGEAAPTAEALMRSRYSAYVLALEPYLLATWHPSTRPSRLGLAADEGSKWLGLEIKRHQAGSPDSADGEPVERIEYIEFVARYKTGGRAHRLRELSRFVRQTGLWYYVDGESPQKAGESGHGKT